MAIEINVTLRTVPGTNGEVKKWYGSINSNGCTSLDQLADRISAMCTVTKPDILGVLAAMQEQVIDTLRNGDGVSFGQLGTMYVHSRSRLAGDAADCTIDKLQAIYPIFHASSHLRKSLAKAMLHFKIKA